MEYFKRLKVLYCVASIGIEKRIISEDLTAVSRLFTIISELYLTYAEQNFEDVFQHMISQSETNGLDHSKHKPEFSSSETYIRSKFQSKALSNA